MSKPSKKKQDEFIESERQKLLSIFENNVTDEQMTIAINLIDRIAFMSNTLAILEDQIKTKGSVYNFEQGSQKMLIESPAQKSYSTLVNRYVSAVKELFNILSKEQQKQVQEDGFDSFLQEK